MDYGVLEYILQKSDDSFFEGSPYSSDVRFYYKRWGKTTSPVLVVAHADTVFRPQASTTTKDNKLCNPGLDDRLGCYTVLHHLPKIMGLKLDTLITDNEESAGSTAEFVSRSLLDEYNWIAEFDRRGEDVVLYSCGSPEFEKALKESGFKIGMGSFSDISKLDTKRCCVNVGVGYHNEHSQNCHMDEAEYGRQMAKFAAMYKAHGKTAFVRPKRSARKTFWDDGYNLTKNNFRFTTSKSPQHSSRFEPSLLDDYCVYCGTTITKANLAINSLGDTCCTDCFEIEGGGK